MIFDHIEWDESNLDHATKRVASAEIEQAVWNATSWTKHKTVAGRRLIRSHTDGGKRVVVIVQVVRDGVRPVTAWEE